MEANDEFTKKCKQRKMRAFDNNLGNLYYLIFPTIVTLLSKLKGKEKSEMFSVLLEFPEFKVVTREIFDMHYFVHVKKKERIERCIYFI